MKNYFWLAESVNDKKSGVVAADNAQLAHSIVSAQLNDNAWHKYVIIRLERLE